MTFRYVMGAPIPTIIRVEATGADTSSVAASITREPMRDQEDFFLPWVGEADEANVIVVTSVGTSLAR